MLDAAFLNAPETPELTLAPNMIHVSEGDLITY
jgi:hypothetical protein